MIDIYGYRYSHALRENHGTAGNNNPVLPSIQDETENNPHAPSPTLHISNPSRESIGIYTGDMFNLRFQTRVHTNRRTIEVKIDDTVIQTANSGDIFVIPVSSAGLSLGDHTMKVSVIDANGNSDHKSFTLTILAR